MRSSHLILSLCLLGFPLASSWSQDTFIGADGIRRSTKGKKLTRTKTSTGFQIRETAPVAAKTVLVPSDDYQRVKEKKIFYSEFTAPWNARLAQARSEIELAPQERLLAQLSSSRNEKVHAALEELRARNIPIALETLNRALTYATQPDTANLAAETVFALGTEKSKKTLADHVARQGFASEKATTLLGGPSSPYIAKAREMHARRNRLLAAAADASERRPSTLRAIRQLATIPGEDVTHLLQQLAADWSKAVRTSATLALNQRAQATR